MTAMTKELGSLCIVCLTAAVVIVAVASLAVLIWTQLL